MLAGHGDISVIAETRNGRETVRTLQELKPDLIFLDIQMPGLDGFEVLHTIGVKHLPAVIFVTAHDEFAVKAFDAQALDYLVKPVRQARFSEALDRMRQRRQAASASDLSHRLYAL